MKKRFGKLHMMSANESPYGPSPLAVKAMKERMRHTNYYPARDDRKVTTALADFFDCGLQPENFITGNGAVDVIRMIENCLFEAGQSNSVVICPPCFGPYADMAQLKGAEVIEHALNPETFAIDISGIKNAVRPDTRIMYVCNPNNPTGTYFGKDELEQILDALPEQVTLVYDTVYYQFATEFDLPSALDCVLENRNIVVLHSFSKAFGMAGMRLGYGIATAEMIKKMRNKKLPFQTSTLSQAAILGGLRDTKFIARVVKRNTVQRHWLQNRLADLGIQFWPSQANFICFKVPPGQDAETLVDALAQYGLMVRAAFYLPQHVRVSIGVSRANRKFIFALSKIVSDLDGGAR